MNRPPSRPDNHKLESEPLPFEAPAPKSREDMPLSGDHERSDGTRLRVTLRWGRTWPFVEIAIVDGKVNRRTFTLRGEELMLVRDALDRAWQILGGGRK